MQTMALEHARVFHARVFPLTLLKDITDNFSEERVIGRGGSGVVYKGVLDSGEEIAVKKLYNRYDSSGNKLGNGGAQFLNELMNLFEVQHQNIIRLVGYCHETRNIVVECDGKRVLASEEEKVLCLEYMQGGSLKDHLSDESRGLDWQVRFNIIKGVCEGLKYLHTGSKKPIYHLDLKPENIWLDGNMMPKIGDFGISRQPVGSMQTYATENAVSGTIGYMAPEYIGWNQISQKCDVYSLGFIMMRVIAGEKGPQNYDPHRPLEEFIERVHENWGKRQIETMSSHSLQQVKTCTKIALKCVEYDREKRPTITDIVDELNKLDAAESSALGGQNLEKEERTTLEKQPDIQEQKEKKLEYLEEKMKEQIDGRTKNNLPALVPMDLPKAVGVMSANLSPPSRRIGSQEPIYLQDDILHLQSDMQRLRDTLPRMYNLINGAEWRSHERCVAELLPKLRDTVYDAEDLLDEFRWHKINVELEGNASKPPFMAFFDTVIQGNFNKLKDVQGRLDRLSSQMEKMGISEVTKSFDNVVRPQTSSFPNEETIFGRDNEMKHVMGLLGVNSKRKRARSQVNTTTSTLPSNQVSPKSRIVNIPVLPIVGIGGVGKTTLAQHICSNKQVKAHFELIIWICVSDDFDVKRLTKEVIQSCPGKKETSDNLDSLQRALSNKVNNKRLLVVLDDIWDDALKENGQSWKRFCAPLKSSQEGSMMLVTTRSPKVIEGVQTMKPVMLEGLKDNDFWEFFRLCAFGSESSNNDPELERIGRCILPKLKGSPLAAKTLGRILRMNLQESRWNRILESELWKLPQEATEILPALRLSYMYLPFHLKQCFSFCAVYPKDYKFRKEDLAEIWVAEGFVEPQGDDPIQDIGCQYFEDLVARSFFQKVNGGYVIHDLLHDMAQKVSEHDCFILRNKNDFDKVPLNVRHIFIHPSNDFDNSNLSSLCKHTKLRTLICKKQFGDKRSSVMDNWCIKLPRIRVMCCASTNDLPDSLGNSKHLRYLKITKRHPLSIPPTFCQLYNLQILDVKTCKIESLPDGFSNLRNLKRFVSQGFSYNPMFVCIIDADEKVGVRLIENLNQFSEHLVISNVEDLPEANLKNKKYLYKLTLNWPGPSKSQIIQHNAVEVRPPKSLRSLLIQSYQGASLPRWSHVINGSIGIFASLTDLTIDSCGNLKSLEDFLNREYVPIIKKIQLHNCNGLVSVPTERFGNLCSLEELVVRGCPNIRSPKLASPSLKQLKLGDCGDLLDNIDCPSLKSFHISPRSVTDIQPLSWTLPALQELDFFYCTSVTSIGVYTFRIFLNFPSLKHLLIRSCPNLNWQGLMLPSSLKTLELCNCGDFSAFVPGCLENLTSLVSLKIGGCNDLTSIPGDIWRSKLALLEELVIQDCLNLVSIGGAEAVAQIKKVEIIWCPKLKEAEQIMKRG